MKLLPNTAYSTSKHSTHQKLNEQPIMFCKECWWSSLVVHWATHWVCLVYHEDSGRDLQLHNEVITSVNKTFQVTAPCKASGPDNVWTGQCPPLHWSCLKCSQTALTPLWLNAPATYHHPFLRKQRTREHNDYRAVTPTSVVREPCESLVLLTTACSSAKDPPGLVNTGLPLHLRQERMYTVVL